MKLHLAGKPLLAPNTAIQLSWPIREYLKPQGLEGISDEQIEEHWELYCTYVEKSNKLYKAMRLYRQTSSTDPDAYEALRKQYGFEFNGVTLHELYFENLAANVALDVAPTFLAALKAQWSTWDNWWKDLGHIALRRGVGWAITAIDPSTSTIINYYLDLHGLGALVGWIPLVVIDLWEHAYMRDFRASEAGLYMDAVMSNINWAIVESRYRTAHACSQIIPMMP